MYIQYSRPEFRIFAESVSKGWADFLQQYEYKYCVLRVCKTTLFKNICFAFIIFLSKTYFRHQTFDLNSILSMTFLKGISVAFFVPL